MKTLIHNATIVNEGRIFVGSVVIDNDIIAEVSENSDYSDYSDYSEVIDATGMILLPGVIDTHVHFRDGGKSENPAGTFYSESRAARAGGVTS
ncbi:MAG: dihydroorotase, partial [Bacteroidales bacterium]|nr:dihydroorotase [Bacteroidales bacterium]